MLLLLYLISPHVVPLNPSLLILHYRFSHSPVPSLHLLLPPNTTTTHHPTQLINPSIHSLPSHFPMFPIQSPQALGTSCSELCSLCAGELALVAAERGEVAGLGCGVDGRLPVELSH
jgi:hypothetical protein